jgi:hypothetical protein
MSAKGGKLTFTQTVRSISVMTGKMTCGRDCAFQFHVPSEVRSKGTSCARYNDWLNAQAASCRTRDRGRIDTLPPLAKYREAIHSAVVRSNGLDAYTGEALEWNLLNHERPPAGGRKNHRKRGRWPSVDHYHGTGQLNYKICSGLVNTAKGPLEHQQFVELCRKVAARHDGWGKKG